MGRCHIQRAAGAPTDAPLATGDHYINTDNGDHYLSKDVATSADWVLQVQNVTHTGEVTGSTTLTMDPTAITNQTTVTAVTGDFVLISDTSDTGALKKVDANDFLGGGAGDNLGNHTATQDLDLSNNKIIGISLGTAAAPSIALTGDTNTGIYSSGADKLDFSTAGTARLTLDSAGNVGIGTAAPASDIHIQAPADNGANIRIDGAAGRDSYIEFYEAGTNKWIMGSDSSASDTFRLKWGATHLANGTHILNISNAGDVAIGITSADEKLEVGGSIMSAPKGVAAGEGGALYMKELAANGANTVGFRAPDSIGTTVTWVLPATDGTSGQVLSTNGAGVLSWITP